jgi:hypothetical protein
MYSAEVISTLSCAKVVETPKIRIADWINNVRISNTFLCLVKQQTFLGKPNGWHNLHTRFRLAGIGAAVAFSSFPKSI